MAANWGGYTERPTYSHRAMHVYQLSILDALAELGRPRIVQSFRMSVFGSSVQHKCCACCIASTPIWTHLRAMSQHTRCNALGVSVLLLRPARRRVAYCEA